MSGFFGGAGGGAVSSVNGQTGNVSLLPEDLGAASTANNLLDLQNPGAALSNIGGAPFSHSHSYQPPSALLSSLVAMPTNGALYCRASSTSVVGVPLTATGQSLISANDAATARAAIEAPALSDIPAALAPANNLSDVVDAAVALENLGGVRAIVLGADWTLGSGNAVVFTSIESGADIVTLSPGNPSISLPPGIYCCGFSNRRSWTSSFSYALVMSGTINITDGVGAIKATNYDAFSVPPNGTMTRDILAPTYPFVVSEGEDIRIICSGSFGTWGSGGRRCLLLKLA